MDLNLILPLTSHLWYRSEMKILLLLTLLCTASWTKGCTTGHIKLVDQRGREVEGRSGIVQLCQESTWSTVCGFDGWSSLTANIACGQLGYKKLYANSTSYNTTGSTMEMNPLILNKTVVVRCQRGELGLTNCKVTTQNNNCYHQQFRQYMYSNVTCKQDCTGGEIRLVGGSTCREGRVEVCVDGHWGTVCGEGWGNTEAGLVCARLESPSDMNNAQVDNFGASSIQPVYNFTCSSSEDDPPNCSATPAPDSCDHSMDLGVRCLTNQETHVATLMEKLRMCESESTTFLAASDSDDHSSGGVTDSSTSSSAGEFRKYTYEAFGVLTGLLAAALVVVTMGWIVSCVYWQKRLKQSKGHTSNKECSTNHYKWDNTLVHDDGTMGTDSQTNYSSTSPTYEELNIKEETGYDVINRRRASGPHPPKTPPGSHDPTLDYSTLKAVNNYHVLEPTIMTGKMVGGERVDTTDDQNRSQQNLQLSLHPQVYEIPIPQNQK